ncbi:MAG: hypothetical protein FJ034_05960 [Chloroflexi bacterium]|nr:hypothetical protein [Chloroflexota bacterium]
MAAPVPGGFFGARFSLYPLTDGFVPVILRAIEGLASSGLEVQTDDVSTFLGGDRDAVFGALAESFTAAARTGVHVVMPVLLSHGCPGEEVCEMPDDQPHPPGAAKRKLARAGVRVSAQWSLYPLGDPAYMTRIEEAIARGKSDRVHVAGRHFVSHLAGDLADVLTSVRGSFDAACERVGHVTAHLVISANSPSTAGHGG